jgi:hypothetical protein
MTGLRLTSLLAFLLLWLTWSCFTNEFRMTNAEGWITYEWIPNHTSCTTEHWTASLHNFGKDQIEITTSTSSSIILCLPVAAENCLATRCPSIVESVKSRMFTEPLPSNGHTSHNIMELYRKDNQILYIKLCSLEYWFSTNGPWIAAECKSYLDSNNETHLEKDFNFSILMHVLWPGIARRYSALATGWIRKKLG